MPVLKFLLSQELDFHVMLLDPFPFGFGAKKEFSFLFFFHDRWDFFCGATSISLDVFHLIPLMPSSILSFAILVIGIACLGPL